MTTHCPIVSRCIRQLRAMVTMLNFDDDDTELSSLADALEAASGDVALVRLRGFLVVEEILRLLTHVYTRTYDQRAPTLGARSWHALTELKRSVEKVIDQATLDIAEQELAGVQVTTYAIYVPKAYETSDLQTLGHKSAGVRSVHTLASSLDHAITLLRPYLRNEDVSVGGLGEELGVCYRTVYGAVAVTPFINITRKLLDVRL